MKQAVYKIICVIAALFIFGASPAQAVNGGQSTDVPPKEWTIWLENLKKEMLAKGISQKTLDAAYKGKNYYHVAPEVVQRDKKQTEFILTTCEYVNRLVTKNRVWQAQTRYKALSARYKDIEEKYNVPLHYLIAFWAIETNFGTNKGNYHLIDSLTNLSYDHRRADFFKNELYNVLKIMEKNHLSDDKMRGSWAGAMGHFQFMPSTYNHYAVDYDGDGVPDIWNSFGDALASAGNYLSQLGWKKDERWGMRVSLPWDFDFKDVGRQHTKTVNEWKELGVKTFYGYSLPLDGNAKASIILPDGRKGPAFIVLGNFKRVMIWNRSDNYALAIVTLAEYIANPKKKWAPMKAYSQYVMTNEEILTLQKFYNTLYTKKIDEDGQLGPKTREAIKKLQKKARLPEDGYPDYLLLSKVKNYDPKIGFAVPVQPARPK